MWGVFWRTAFWCDSGGPLNYLDPGANGNCPKVCSSLTGKKGLAFADVRMASCKGKGCDVIIYAGACSPERGPPSRPLSQTTATPTRSICWAIFIPMRSPPPAGPPFTKGLSSLKGASGACVALRLLVGEGLPHGRAGGRKGPFSKSTRKETVEWRLWYRVGLRSKKVIRTGLWLPVSRECGFFVVLPFGRVKFGR